MKNFLFGYAVMFFSGLACGLGLSSILLRDHAVVVGLVPTVPSASASAAHSGPRIEWCTVTSYRSIINDVDPMGPMPLRWSLDGYFPDGTRKTVDTGDTRDEMIARAKALSCPLRGE